MKKKRAPKPDTLSQALAKLGITHARSEMSDGDGRRTWFAADGSVIGRYDAHEGWEKIKTVSEQPTFSFDEAA